MINSEITKQGKQSALDDKLWGDGIGIDNATNGLRFGKILEL